MLFLGHKGQVTIFSNPQTVCMACLCTHQDMRQLFDFSSPTDFTFTYTTDSTSADEKLCFVSKNPPRYLLVCTVQGHIT